jgi:Arc/MetJ family transcription regulator
MRVSTSLDLLLLRRYFELMKEMTITIDDELYARAQRKLTDVEADVSQHVTEYLQAINGDDDRIAAARARLADMFVTTRGFGVGERPSREEMHERGSIR